MPTPDVERASVVPVACPACGRPTPPALGTTASALGNSVQIFECPACQTQYSEQQDSAALYDEVYAAADVAGYDRYRERASAMSSGRGLDWLASQDAGYALVAETVGPRSGATIAEVGTGLGYLTHALRGVGHDAIGFDISSTAVALASEQFGAHFSVGSAEAMPKRSLDVVVALEVIEHVTDPASFLEACLAALGPDGVAIFTTPNRDYLPKRLLWRTDPPPVHLHWFTRAGITALCDRVGADVEFVALEQFDVAENQLMRFARLSLHPMLPRPGRTATPAISGAVRSAGQWSRRAPALAVGNFVHRLLWRDHHRLGFRCRPRPG